MEPWDSFFPHYCKPTPSSPLGKSYISFAMEWYDRLILVIIIFRLMNNSLLCSVISEPTILTLAMTNLRTRNADHNSQDMVNPQSLQDHSRYIRRPGLAAATLSSSHLSLKEGQKSLLRAHSSHHRQSLLPRSARKQNASQTRGRHHTRHTARGKHWALSDTSMGPYGWAEATLRAPRSEVKLLPFRGGVASTRASI